MHALRFEKWEGLGNDFIVVESDREDAMTPGIARAICDRRFGVGADGVILVLPAVTSGATARMRVINSDGSIPEMCGNGLRCAVLHRAKGRASEIVFDTDAGERRCVVGADGQVTVDMGEVRVGGEVEIALDGETWSFTTADAGNPHAVSTREISDARFREVGPRIASHDRFPKGTNVEFARFGRDAIDLVVWERGAGATLACGTGACATAAVAVARGAFEAGKEIAVRLPGGELGVTIASSGRATMRGPARMTFAGELDLDAYAKRIG
jgi:diaminopimelate epimerase